MKKLFASTALVIVAALFAVQAKAESNVGQCVTQKSSIKKGKLVMAAAPIARKFPFGPVIETAPLMNPADVVDQKDHMLQVADPATAQVIGWVSIKEVEFTALRNCNFAR